ncbi:MAG: hypothetical protein QOC96_911 [Acidobacteriota bacterium]|jgi:hypothetical protein|nr:hypothetical protein [Acidobacteriota bacterium]
MFERCVCEIGFSVQMWTGMFTFVDTKLMQAAA